MISCSSHRLERTTNQRLRIGQGLRIQLWFHKTAHIWQKAIWDLSKQKCFGEQDNGYQVDRCHFNHQRIITFQLNTFPSNPQTLTSNILAFSSSFSLFFFDVFSSSFSIKADTFSTRLHKKAYPISPLKKKLVVSAIHYGNYLTVRSLGSSLSNFAITEKASSPKHSS